MFSRCPLLSFILRPFSLFLLSFRSIYIRHFNGKLKISNCFFPSPFWSLDTSIWRWKNKENMRLSCFLARLAFLSGNSRTEAQIIWTSLHQNHNCLYFTCVCVALYNVFFMSSLIFLYWPTMFFKFLAVPSIFISFSWVGSSKLYDHRKLNGHTNMNKNWWNHIVF